jgi:CheY-like chemotaxis protein
MKMVLIVDDEPDLRFVLRLSLGQRYEVVEAENGQRALEAIAERRPDVVITDLMMPVLSGPELIARLRADPDLRDIPIIAVSAMSAPDVNVDAVMRKPFSPQALADLVDRLAG